MVRLMDRTVLTVDALSGLSHEEVRQIVISLKPFEQANEPAWLAHLAREVISEWIRLCILKGRTASLEEKDQ